MTDPLARTTYLLGLLLLVSSCKLQVEGARCEVDGHCPDPQFCQEGRCVTGERRDAGLDAGVDAGLDAGVDAGVDGGSTMDAGSTGDAGTSPDGGTAGCEAGAGCDAGSACGDGGACGGSACDAGFHPDAGACEQDFPLGDECGLDDECLSGHCVRGACCDSACGGTCSTCAPDGLCQWAARGEDPHDQCDGALACNGDGGCLLPNGAPCTVETAANCESGLCVDGLCCNRACGGGCETCSAGTSPGTCEPVPSGSDPRSLCGLTWCSGSAATCPKGCALDTECKPGSYCNGGACKEKKTTGTACTDGKECASGNCADGLCCTSSCAAPCQACNGTDSPGTCVVSDLRTDPDSECGWTWCSGATACLQACQSDSDCKPAAWCAAGTCTPKRARGEACNAPNQCASNACADGVCCDNACGGTCRACDVAGARGTCTDVPAHTDPASECAGSTTCNGDGGCLLSNGNACGANAECESGQCVDGYCCESACAGACQACNRLGARGTCTAAASGMDPENDCALAVCGASGCLTTCTSDVHCKPTAYCDGSTCLVKKALGLSCAAGNECSSGNCVDGVCCGSDCGGTCRACNLLGAVGACTDVPVRMDPANDCGAALCSGAAGACISPCAADADCKPGNYCNGTSCVSRKALGVSCAAGNECSSGNCVDGACCDTACDGACQACNSGKTGQTTGTCGSITVNTDPDAECTAAAYCAGTGACFASSGSSGAVPCSNDANCKAGHYCDGAACMPLKGNGLSCTADGECTSGSCADGVCCGSRCGGTCQACNLVGAVGSCENLPAYTDPANECAGTDCSGQGTCLKADGAACALAAECQGGNCAGGSCCSTGCGVPDPPTAVVGTAGAGQVTLSWTAPASSGSYPVTDYVVEYSVNGSIWIQFADGTSTATSAAVTGLTNGTAYTFRVAAVSVVGQGAFSDASAAVTPRTVPVAPTNITGTVGNGQVTLSWTVPNSNGGSAITNYVLQYSSTNGSSWLTAASRSPASPSTVTSNVVVSGLSNGTAYVFRVAAENVAGMGLFSDNSPTLVPFTVPASPTTVSATSYENAQSVVTWTPVPAGGDGGNTVLDYTATTNDGKNCTATGASASTCTLTGLTNGTSYTVTVKARNAAGSSAASVPSSFKPSAVPSAPTGPSGTSYASGQSVISWTVVANTVAGNGGDAVIDYTATTNDGKTCTATGASATSCTLTGLTNGTAYTVTVKARNNSGSSVASGVSASFKPSTVPSAPTGASGTSGANAQSVISWTAVPVGNNGGDPVIDYTATSSPGGLTCTATGASATSCTLTGLTNGTAYTVTVRARNNSGSSTASAASASFSPSTVPGAPGTPLCVAGYQAVTVGWTAPASNGGSAVTDYVVEYSTDGSAWTTFADGVSTALSTTVTGLSNGTAYLFRVAAVNARGTGNSSSVSSAATPLAVPDVPTNVTGTPGVGQVSLSWSAPASDGGSAITDYVVQYSTDRSAWTTFADGTSTSLSATVTGLTNGTAYYFRAAAVNVTGTGLYSASSSALTPASALAAPTGAAGTSNYNGQSVITWTAVPSGGSDPVIDYTATTSPGNFTCTATGASATTCTITGLTNGTSYTVTVKARNNSGSSAASTASASFKPANVPVAPTNAAGTSNANAQSVISWTAVPATVAGNGGDAVIDYTATTSPGNFTCTATGASATTCTITGLTNGTSYTVTVKARNNSGSSAASTASANFKPATVPNAPTSPAGTSNANAQSVISWTAVSAANNGGSAIIDYTATTSPGNFTCTATGASANTCTITGLSNGTGYTVTVKARNAVGSSAASSTSATFTPATVPGAPGQPTLTNGTASQLGVSWAAPGSNGGAAITGYTATATASGQTTRTCTTTGATSCTISTLTNGVTYAVTVTATNAAGTGSASASSSAVVNQVPGAPSITSGNQTNALGQASLTFSAATAPGTAVTDYIFEFATNSALTSSSTFNPTATNTQTTQTVTGLSTADAGEDYWFRVAAINSVGQGAFSGIYGPIKVSAPSEAQTVSASGTLASQKEARLWFTAPAYTGGRTITGYAIECSTDAGATWLVGAPSTTGSAPTSVSPLAITGDSTGNFSNQQDNIRIRVAPQWTATTTQTGTMSSVFNCEAATTANDLNDTCRTDITTAAPKGSLKLVN